MPYIYVTKRQLAKNHSKPPSFFQWIIDFKAWPNPRRIFTRFSLAFLFSFEKFDETINTSTRLDVSSHARKLGKNFSLRIFWGVLPLGQMTYEVWLVLTRPSFGPKNFNVYR